MSRIFHYLSVFDYTDCPCFEVKDEEDLLLEKTVRGYKTGRGISTGLRHIFAIVSPQISTMMEPCNAILEHEPANRRIRFDIRFLSSLSIIHVLTSGPKFHCTKSHALEISPFALMPARISRVNVRKHSVGLRTYKKQNFHSIALYALYLSVSVFSTKGIIGETIFYVSYWRRDPPI